MDYIGELPQVYNYSSTIGYASAESNVGSTDTRGAESSEVVSNEESGKIIDTTV